jgi:hypothetical protein
VIVGLGSIFSNSIATLDKYIAGVVDLRDRLEARGDGLVCLWVEGDSEDETWEQLHYLACKERLVAFVEERSHGNKVFPSVEDNQRFKQLAWVANGVLEQISDDVDVFLWVESDIEWDAETALRLIDHVRDGHVMATCPVWFINSGWGSQWYDTFAFRKDSLRFEPHPPYHPCLSADSALVEIDSCGSIWALRGDVARRVRFTPESCCVGLCEQAREMGHSIVLDKTLGVVHPKRAYD